MNVFLKELNFRQHTHTYIEDITPKVNEAIKKSQIEMDCYCKYTPYDTWRFGINEIARPNLLTICYITVSKAFLRTDVSTRVTKAYTHPTTGNYTSLSG